MNAKKITSLVLAAMMAVGTSVTAFAEIDVEGNLNADNLNADRPLGFGDTNVYVDRDGILVQNPDEYRPGDTIYIRLTEYWADKSKGEKDSKIEDEKERMNVYADWKVGKDAVEDMDIVYDKGSFYTSDENTTLTFKVDGVSFEVSDVDTRTDIGLLYAIKRELIEQIGKDTDFLKDEIAAEYAKYFDSEGWVVDGKYYADAAAAAKAAGYTETNGYAIYNGQAFGKDDLVDYLEARGFEKVVEKDKYYVDIGEWTNTGYGKVAETGTPINPDSVTAYVGEINGELYYVNCGKVTAIGSVLPILPYDIGVAYVKGADAFVNAEDAIAEAVKDGVAVKASDVMINDADDIVVDKEIVRDDVIDKVTSAIANDVVANKDYSVDWDNKYTYWVKIDTVEDDTTKVVDLAGILYVGRTRNKAEDADNAFHLDAPLSNRVNDSTNYVTVDDEYTFKPDSRSVVKFDKDADDVVLYFGENEDAWFEVDARGQSALNLEFTFDFNREIADLFPKANIDFLTFTSEPSFNRTGTLYIVADADSFIYEVTENGVKEIANAEYDEDEEAWVIRTRKLAAYAISDRELDTSITLDGEDNTSSVDADGNKQNPDTGR